MSPAHTVPGEGVPTGALNSLVKAIVSGCAIAFIGLGMWSALLIGGMQFPHLVWLAVPVMAAVLFVGGLYLKYGTWPRAGRVFRSEGVRLNPVRLRPFLFALAAGWSTMAA